ncbi:MAG TPA: dTDP-4-dehydrorhamnose reductase [Allosphingosinicella sp.]|jgi:dTDP-4-dehydrorhamnose reductase
MKVLVTGRAGQLVRSLVERSAGVPELEIAALGRPELDLEVPGSAAAAVRRAAPDVVINAAAYTAVDLAEDEPERAMRINGDAAGEIAAAARGVGAAIVQISTDYVFDGRRPTPYREDASTAPLGAYGRSKLAGEEQVRRSNPDHLILRTAWVYSPFGQNFVKTMMRVAQSRGEITVVADQQGNPTSALDLADALLAVLERCRHGERTGLGSAYHLAGTGSTSWFGFAEAIFQECRALGFPAAEVRPIRTSDWPTKAVRPTNSRLDSSRFAADFAFAMPHWRQSLGEVVRRLGAS